MSEEKAKLLIFIYFFIYIYLYFSFISPLAKYHMCVTRYIVNNSNDNLL